MLRRLDRGKSRANQRIHGGRTRKPTKEVPLIPSIYPVWSTPISRIRCVFSWLERHSGGDGGKDPNADALDGNQNTPAHNSHISRLITEKEKERKGYARKDDEYNLQSFANLLMTIPMEYRKKLSGENECNAEPGFLEGILPSMM